MMQVAEYFFLADKLNRLVMISNDKSMRLVPLKTQIRLVAENDLTSRFNSHSA